MNKYKCIYKCIYIYKYVCDKYIPFIYIKSNYQYVYSNNMFTDTYIPLIASLTAGWNLTMALRADSFEQLPPKGHRTNHEA